MKSPILPKSVWVAMPTRHGNPHQEAFWAALQAANYEPCAHSGVEIYPNPYSVAANRNGVVEAFLRTGCTHLMTIDADVVLQCDAISLLLSLNADVATGYYPISTEAMVHMACDAADGAWVTKWQDETREVHRCGAGCLLIARRVLEKLKPPWFKWPQMPRKSPLCEDPRTEDMRFCDEVRALGFKIMAHHQVRCGHHSSVDVAKMIDHEWAGPLTAKQQAMPPAWASHQPVLRAAAEFVPLRKVIEFGAGKYSTPFFLDRAVFPDLEQLVSVEHDPEWLRKLRDEIKDDRWHPQLEHVEMMPELAALLEPADLVLIDSGRPTAFRADYHLRGALLEYYAASESIVVMHDVETNPLHDYSNDAKYKYKGCYMPPLGPHTGIFCNVHDVAQLKL